MTTKTRRPSYTKASGWDRSRRERLPVNAEGAPLPWYTYAAIAFLEPRLTPHFDVFEYGAGHSTLWYAARCGGVSAVEHDQDWVERLTPSLPGNASVRFVPEDEDGAYAAAAAALDRSFDIIVIDGRDRVNCIKRALPALKPNGVVVWDNAERVKRYQDGFDLLKQHRFRAIEFDGMGPINTYGWRTSIYYRGDNCLGI